MFFDDDFGFRSQLVPHWEEMREELLNLDQDMFRLWPQRDMHNDLWFIFGLWVQGRRITANCALCPRTAELAATIPGMKSAGFSALAPGAVLRPHCGPESDFLRYHIGLVVPPNCGGLKVGDETRGWEDGKDLCFDDHVEHTAWNDSDQTRVVFLVDFVKPWVTGSQDDTVDVADEGIEQILGEHFKDWYTEKPTETK